MIWVRMLAYITGTVDQELLVWHSLCTGLGLSVASIKSTPET